MPLVSIITAVKQGTEDFFLDDLYRSLKEQDLDWEWLLQWDGPAGRLPEGAQGDVRVKEEANNRRLLTAMSRNRALLRSSGDLIRNLDADDYLVKDCLAKQVEVLRRENVGFAPGAEISLETQELSLPRLPKGLITCGSLETYWRREKSIAISHATILWKKETIWRAGGWPAQSGMDDVALALLANIEEEGFLIYDPVLIRRSHAGQNTIQPDYIRDRTINKKLIHERLRARREWLGLDIDADLSKAPEDINRAKAIRKSQQFGHKYE